MNKQGLPDETTIAMAGDTWKTVYGRPRKRKQERSDSGQPKLKKLKTGVPVWQKVEKRFPTWQARVVLATWRSSLAAELDFLAKKRQEALCDAICDGTFPVDKAGAKQHRNHLLGLKNDRAKDETKRREALTHIMTPIDPDKHHVYFATDIPLHHAQAAINGAGGYAPTITNSLVDADFFALKDFSFTNNCQSNFTRWHGQPAFGEACWQT